MYIKTDSNQSNLDGRSTEYFGVKECFTIAMV